MSEKHPSVALREVEGRLIGRAWEDAAFKETLLRDPLAAIEQATGLKLPPGLTVKVVEESENTLYLVLPLNPLAAEEEGELSEADLATVAGGDRGVPTQPGYPHPACNP